MTAAKRWLPPGTLPPPALQADLGGLVDAWSQRWFAASSLALQPLGRDMPGDFAWRGIAQGLMLGCARTARTDIGAWVIGVDAERRGERDRALLEEVGEACLADLRAGLMTLIRAAEPTTWPPIDPQGGWIATIGGRPALLAIGVSDALFADLVARSLPPVAPPLLGSGLQALAKTMVAVGVAVGRSRLSVAELRGLEIGDVVMLDSHVDERAPIAVDGRPLIRGQVQIDSAENGPSVLVVQGVMQ